MVRSSLLARTAVVEGTVLAVVTVRVVATLGAGSEVAEGLRLIVALTIVEALEVDAAVARVAGSTVAIGITDARATPACDAIGPVGIGAVVASATFDAFTSEAQASESSSAVSVFVAMNARASLHVTDLVGSAGAFASARSAALEAFETGGAAGTFCTAFAALAQPLVDFRAVGCGDAAVASGRGAQAALGILTLRSFATFIAPTVEATDR